MAEMRDQRAEAPSQAKADGRSEGAPAKRCKQGGDSAPTHEGTNQHQPSKRSRFALAALNFTFADIQTGVGPYLAIYLTHMHHWDAAAIGIATSSAGFATVVAQTPAGAIIDHVTFKRTLLLVAALVGGAGAVALIGLQPLGLVVAAQIIIGAGFAFVPPGIAAITLGMVGGAVLAAQQGRNQAWNAGGNVAFAVIAGLLGYFATLSWIFYFVGLLGILTAVFSYTIKKRDIDDKIARQAPENDETPHHVSEPLAQS